ncbi:conserved hypothetical protein ['Nostoc azollae' 0708]|jgi:hypothetical protein|uniref:Uncharacterized protein n=1 Tax=Nostoc azollae (strain 0708) TaxID=551115 RepID=D7E0D3_NOSA0|nr:conserved hypothetical protein ['Nostoc azollae' 0708]
MGILGTTIMNKETVASHAEKLNSEGDASELSPEL